MKANEKKGNLASEWGKLFFKAGIRADTITNAKSSRVKSILIGQFLSPSVGRVVSIQVKGRTGKATLQVRIGRSKEKRYWFEICWDDQPDPRPSGKRAVTQGDGKMVSPKKPKQNKKQQQQAPISPPATKATKRSTNSTKKGNDLDW